jgi:hypothetical protein
MERGHLIRSVAAPASLNLPGLEEADEAYNPVNG